MFFRTDPYLYLFHLGDLDPFFWPRTTWYGLKDNQELTSVLLLYASLPTPTLLLFFHENKQETGIALLEQASGLLPRKFYAHLSPGCSQALERSFHIKYRGRFLRLGHKEKNQHLLNTVNTNDVLPLGLDSLDELLEFYKQSYPENWFDPKMLKTGYYYGVRSDSGNIISAGGVHVFSEKYGVSSLGNIATLKEHRNQGLSTKVTAKISLELLKSTPVIGFNVRQSNKAALRCYHKLGFEYVAEYDEYLFTAKRNDGEPGTE